MAAVVSIRLRCIDTLPPPPIRKSNICARYGALATRASPSWSRSVPIKAPFVPQKNAVAIVAAGSRVASRSMPPRVRGVPRNRGCNVSTVNGRGNVPLRHCHLFMQIAVAPSTNLTGSRSARETRVLYVGRNRGTCPSRIFSRSSNEIDEPAIEIDR